jgi:hypothetical protein
LGCSAYIGPILKNTNPSSQDKQYFVCKDSFY